MRVEGIKLKLLSSASTIVVTIRRLDLATLRSRGTLYGLRSCIRRHTVHSISLPNILDRISDQLGSFIDHQVKQLEREAQLAWRPSENAHSAVSIIPSENSRIIPPVAA